MVIREFTLSYFVYLCGITKRTARLTRETTESRPRDILMTTKVYHRRQQWRMYLAGYADDSNRTQRVYLFCMKNNYLWGQSFIPRVLYRNFWFICSVSATWGPLNTFFVAFFVDVHVKSQASFKCHEKHFVPCLKLAPFVTRLAYLYVYGKFCRQLTEATV